MRIIRSYHRSAVRSLLIWALIPCSAFASTPVPTPPGEPLASQFPGPDWSVVTPTGGSVLCSNGHLFLNVPGGSNHDSVVPTNQSVRAMQPIGNVNFDVSTKIDSDAVAAEANTSQGLMALADNNDYVSLALSTDGTNVHLIATTSIAGVATKVYDDPTFGQHQAPFYLRLARSGSVHYTASYSVDGTVWTQATTFDYIRVPAWLGLFAGNYNSVPANAVPVVMAVNWFNVE